MWGHLGGGDLLERGELGSCDKTCGSLWAWLESRPLCKFRDFGIQGLGRLPLSIQLFLSIERWSMRCLAGACIRI